MLRLNYYIIKYLNYMFSVFAQKVNQISKELCYYKFYSQYNDLTNHHIHNENSVIQHYW